MAQISYTSIGYAQPEWAAEQLTPEKLLPGGARLDPGAFPVDPSYTIQIVGNQAALGATEFTVAALPVAIPAGTTLDFGLQAVSTITASATPADDATTLAVAAIDRAIPAGTYLSFGSGKFAIVTTAAARGATSLTTLAMAAATKPANTNTATLPAFRKIAKVTTTAIVGQGGLITEAINFQPSLIDGIAGEYEKASYALGTARPVRSGTLVGRTFSERTSGTGFHIPPDVDSSPDDQLYLIAFDVADATINADCTLLRHGTLVYEDKLPGWSGASSNVKTAIRSRYQCIAS